MRIKLFLNTAVCLFLSNATFANDADLCKSKIESESYTGAVPYCEKACNLNEGLSCNNLGWLYYKGKGVEQNYQQAKTYYEKACDLNYGSGCLAMGDIIEENKGLFSVMKTYYKKACDLNDGMGCQKLGYYGRDIQSLEKSCDLDVGKGCNQLGKVYESPEHHFHYYGDISNFDPDYQKAKMYYEKACDILNYAKGCYSLGYLYDHKGIGIKLIGEIKENIKFRQKEEYLLEKTITYYKKACDMNDEEGCSALGFKYKVGQDVKKDYQQAIKYYEKACDLMRDCIYEKWINEMKMEMEMEKGY